MFTLHSEDETVFQIKWEIYPLLLYIYQHYIWYITSFMLIQMTDDIIFMSWHLLICPSWKKKDYVSLSKDLPDSADGQDIINLYLLKFLRVSQKHYQNLLALTSQNKLWIFTN